MKKTLQITLLISFMLIGGSITLKGQCRLLSDSIIVGDDIGERADYFYNGSDQLVKIVFTRSGLAAGFDTLTYNASGFFDTLKIFFDAQGSKPDEVMTYTRNGSNQITRIHTKAESPFADTFTVAYDLTYNGNGEITDIVLDSTSLTGNSEPAFDFRNIVWSGGNATNVDLVGDFGLGLDTIELSATYDNKINAESKSPPEYDDILFFFNTNNILEATFDNDEQLGPAGSLALSQSYTYNANNEVDTFRIDSNIFDPETEAFIMTYDCPVGLEEPLTKTMEIEFYPNPFEDELFIKVNSPERYRLRLISIEGKLLLDHFYTGRASGIEIENLPSGIYLAEVIIGGETIRKKLIKN